MRIEKFLTIASLAVFFLLTANETGAAATTVLTEKDRTGVELTVYNNNFALVRDFRRAELGAGRNALEFRGVPATVVPETIRVRSIDPPGGLIVLEQSYGYDLMSQEKLLERYVGKEIRLEVWNEFQDRKESVSAVLLSAREGQIFRIGEEVWLGYPGIRVLPELPADLIDRPTLFWLYESETGGPHELEATYLADNINWRADYMLVLNSDEARGDLTGWVTLENRSGAAFEEAGVKFAAGEVARVRSRGAYKADFAYAAEAPMAEGLAERSLFEYHIYDLARKTTIKDNEKKQIRLLEAAGLKTVKEFLVKSQGMFYASRHTEPGTREPVNVYISFRNTGEDNLGVPLPAGIMRLYKLDESGSLEFIGEDAIAHTATGEEVRVRTGSAFDITAERTQTSFRQISTRLYETAWEVVLRNQKSSTVTVGVVEGLTNTWEVTTSSHPYEKVDAFTIRFDVKVPPGEEARLSYTVRVGI